MVTRLAEDQREVVFDLPIQDWSEDRLNRGPLIQSIAELVLRDNAPVVAVIGGFGEGKTSALNLLAASLECRPDVLVVQFSSWLPGDEDAFRQHCRTNSVGLRRARSWG